MRAQKPWRARREGGEFSSPPMPMPPLVWRLLAARGFSSARAIQNFLTPSLGSMTDPLLLQDMDRAVERLGEAFRHREQVCIYGDYDLDGSSGVALLVLGLRGLGFEKVSYYQPSRFLEGYGIHGDALETIAKRGDKIVVSVDCGITAVDEARKAAELGLDLIITDHHLPREDQWGKKILPQCTAVVNPNRGDCPSQLKHLSGVGVGFYLLLALRRSLVSSYDPKSLLDLFTIGTLTDMVPLTAENRVLVKHGLKELAKTSRPGLRALLKRLDLLNRDLDSQDIGFTLAPKLNALSRLEPGLRPVDIFLCEDHLKASELAEKVMGFNDQRKSLQEDLQNKILVQLDEQATDTPAIVLAAEGHAGVVGLVATKVAQLTGKPSFIVTWDGDTGVGSARGLEEDLLPGALSEAACFLERYGGHAQAAGFSMRRSDFEGFRQAILKHYFKRTREAGQHAPLVFDTEAAVFEFTENFMDWLRHAGPFGNENPPPLFRLNSPSVASLRWMKGQHLKLGLQDKGVSLEAVAFFAKDKFHAELGEKLELLVEPAWNYWQGQKRVQLVIRDLRRPGTV